jgi:hypothetical protein
MLNADFWQSTFKQNSLRFLPGPNGPYAKCTSTTFREAEAFFLLRHSSDCNNAELAVVEVNRRLRSQPPGQADFGRMTGKWEISLNTSGPKNERLNEGLRCVPYRCLGVIRALVSPSKSVSLGTHNPKILWFKSTSQLFLDSGHPLLGTRFICDPFPATHSRKS